MTNILSFFQLCDSSLPVGAFSHSFGLESYIQDAQVYNQQTFCKWLDLYLNEQLAHADGLACKLVYEALEKDDLDEIWNLDRILTVQSSPSETREGVQKMGTRMIELIESIYTIPLITSYKQRVANRQSFGHPAIAFTITAHHLHTSQDEAILYYLYQATTSMIQNAVRAIPLGQTTGQKMIHQYNQKITETVSKIKKLTEDDLGVVSPGLEIAQMQHERVKIRIFMS